MDLHRRALASHILPFRSAPPFSCFDWVEANIAQSESIRRCFSLARSLGMRAFIAEDISAEGIILEENQELKALASDHTMPALKRLSFWTEPITKIESGCGALLGFRMTGPSASCEKHIIPFYGHTFNKDTWVPDADCAYFDVGGGIGYIPSESWTSSFLGHDDNFGPNLCVPRLYVRSDQAEYVVELLRDGVAYSGVHAEAITLIFLYSLWPHLAKSANPWMKRLAAAAHPDVRRVVLRAVCVSKDVYLEHVREDADWDGNRETPDLVAILDRLLPKMLWVVEISLPHLFPANEHKLGEILLNPSIPFDPKTPINYALFLLSRLPGRVFVLQSAARDTPSFMEVPSACESHRALLKI